MAGAGRGRRTLAHGNRRRSTRAASWRLMIINHERCRLRSGGERMLVERKAVMMAPNNTPQAERFVRKSNLSAHYMVKTRAFSEPETVAW